jgi:hypothetical protein
MVSDESRSQTGLTASPLIVGLPKSKRVGFLDQVDERLRVAAFEVVERDAHLAGSARRRFGAGRHGFGHPARGTVGRDVEDQQRSSSLAPRRAACGKAHDSETT